MKKWTLSKSFEAVQSQLTLFIHIIFENVLKTIREDKLHVLVPNWYINWDKSGQAEDGCIPMCDRLYSIAHKALKRLLFRGMTDGVTQSFDFPMCDSPHDLMTCPREAVFYLVWAKGFD